MPNKLPEADEALTDDVKRLHEALEPVLEGEWYVRPDFANHTTAVDIAQNKLGIRSRRFPDVPDFAGHEDDPYTHVGRHAEMTGFPVTTASSPPDQLAAAHDHALERGHKEAAGAYRFWLDHPRKHPTIFPESTDPVKELQKLIEPVIEGDTYIVPGKQALAFGTPVDREAAYYQRQHMRPLGDIETRIGNQELQAPIGAEQFRSQDDPQRASRNPVAAQQHEFEKFHNVRGESVPWNSPAGLRAYSDKAEEMGHGELAQHMRNTADRLEKHNVFPESTDPVKELQKLIDGCEAVDVSSCAHITGQQFHDKTRKGVTEDEHDAPKRTPEEEMAVRKKVDLIVLPEDIAGTNCGNCRHIDSDGDFCDHPDIKLPVTAKNCCVKWDAPGVVRPFGKSLYESTIKMCQDLAIQRELGAIVDLVEAENSTGTAPESVLVSLMEAEHKFATTQFNFPTHISTKIKEFSAKIPDKELADKGRETKIHATVLYGLHGIDDLDALPKLVGAFGPVTLTLGEISVFPPSPGHEFDVLKAEVLGGDIHKLNQLLKTRPHTCRFDVYKPHVTIAYLKPGMGAKYAGRKTFKGIEWTFDSLSYYDQAGKGMQISLVANTPEKELARVMESAIYDADIAEAGKIMRQIGGDIHAIHISGPAAHGPHTRGHGVGETWPVGGGKWAKKVAVGEIVYFYPDKIARARDPEGLEKKLGITGADLDDMRLFDMKQAGGQLTPQQEDLLKQRGVLKKYQGKGQGAFVVPGDLRVPPEATPQDVLTGMAQPTTRHATTVKPTYKGTYDPNAPSSTSYDVGSGPPAKYEKEEYVGPLRPTDISVGGAGERARRAEYEALNAPEMRQRISDATAKFNALQRQEKGLSLTPEEERLAAAPFTVEDRAALNMYQGYIRKAANERADYEIAKLTPEERQQVEVATVKATNEIKTDPEAKRVEGFFPDVWNFIQSTLGIAYSKAHEWNNEFQKQRGLPPEEAARIASGLATADYGIGAALAARGQINGKPGLAKMGIVGAAFVPWATVGYMTLAPFMTAFSQPGSFTDKLRAGVTSPLWVAKAAFRTVTNTLDKLGVGAVQHAAALPHQYERVKAVDRQGALADKEKTTPLSPAEKTELQTPPPEVPQWAKQTTGPGRKRIAPKTTTGKRGRPKSEKLQKLSPKGRMDHRRLGKRISSNNIILTTLKAQLKDEPMSSKREELAQKIKEKEAYISQLERERAALEQYADVPAVAGLWDLLENELEAPGWEGAADSDDTGDAEGEGETESNLTPEDIDLVQDALASHADNPDWYMVLLLSAYGITGNMEDAADAADAAYEELPDGPPADEMAAGKEKQEANVIAQQGADAPEAVSGATDVDVLAQLTEQAPTPPQTAPQTAPQVGHVDVQAVVQEQQMKFMEERQRLVEALVQRPVVLSQEPTRLKGKRWKRDANGLIIGEEEYWLDGQD